MDSALSLKTGHRIYAQDANYDSQRKFILVCPECSEPVHLRRRTASTNTSYFAHSEYKGDSTEDVCSLRVLSYWDQPYENSGPWSSKGQLVQKIQLELISYFSGQFGHEKDTVLLHIKNSIKENSNTKNIKSTMIEFLVEKRQAEVFKKIRETADLTNDEGREISAHYNIVVSCLNTKQLSKAAHGLIWCSFIVASSLSDEYVREPEPHIGAICGKERADFALDPKKFDKLISGKSKFPKTKNLIFYRCIHICQMLLLRLLITWKNKTALKNTSFTQLCEKPEFDVIGSNVTKPTKNDLTPVFRTLEERNRWLGEKGVVTNKVAPAKTTQKNIVPTEQYVKVQAQSPEELAADAKRVAYWNRRWGKA